MHHILQTSFLLFIAQLNREKWFFTSYISYYFIDFGFIPSDQLCRVYPPFFHSFFNATIIILSRRRRERLITSFITKYASLDELRLWPPLLFEKHRIIYTYPAQVGSASQPENMIISISVLIGRKRITTQWTHHLAHPTSFLQLKLSIFFLNSIFGFCFRNFPF